MHRIEEFLFYDGICTVDDSVWIILTGKNMLAGIKIETGELFKCISIPTDSKTLIPYRFMLADAGKLYILPYDEKSICIYDIQSESFERISIPMECFECEEKCRFAGGKIVDGKLYAHGIHSSILVYDLVVNRFKIIDLELKKPKQVKINNWFWGNSYYENGRLLLFTQEPQYMVSIDVVSYEIEFIRIEGEDRIIDNPNYSNGVMIYSSRQDHGIVKKYDIGTSKSEIIYEDDTYNLASRCFGYIYSDGIRTVILPGQNKKTVYIDCNEKSTIQKFEERKYKKLGTVFPYEFIFRNGCVDCEHHLIAINSWDRELIDIDIETGDIDNRKIRISEGVSWIGVLKEWIENDKNDIINETFDGMLEAFVEHVKDL